MKTTIWIRKAAAMVMAGMIILPVQGLANECDSGHQGSGSTQDVSTSEPAYRETDPQRDDLLAAAVENMPDDPLEGPEWDTNHDMRGILYGENGEEIRRLGRESRRHREAREERERREREERERRERERRERQERERREREERERREQERRERQERERREREERERREREERERQERERREAEEREREEREARNHRPLTPQEQAAAATQGRPDSRREREIRNNERVERAYREHAEESSRYGRGSQAPGWSGSSSNAAQVGEQMAEVAGGGPIPATAVNVVGEVNRVAPVLRARNELINSLLED